MQVGVARLEVHPSPWLLKVLHPAEETPESLVFVSERVVGRQNIKKYVPSRMMKTVLQVGTLSTVLSSQAAREPALPAAQPVSRSNSMEAPSCGYTLSDFEFRWGLSQVHFPISAGMDPSFLHFFTLRSIVRNVVSSPSQDWHHSRGCGLWFLAVLLFVV